MVSGVEFATWMADAFRCLRALAGLIGTVVYSRVDTNGDLREVRIGEPANGGSAAA
jgi:hypothetical protein